MASFLTKRVLYYYMPEFPPGRVSKATIKEAMTEHGYTSDRAVKIDQTDEILVTEAPVEGTASFAVVDVYPKTVEMVKKEIGQPFYLEGLITFAELAVDESIKVAEKAKLKAAGAYELYADEKYSGVQDEPVLHVVTVESAHGLSVELTMDDAPPADRAFDYTFFVKKKTV